MKKPILLFLIALISTISFSQDFRKQINELDTAFYHGEYRAAEKLVLKIYPNISAIKDDTLVIEFLSTSGSVYYNLEVYDKAETFFSQAAERAKAILGENEYHYSLAIFNIAACYKEQGRYAEAEPLYLKSLPVLANAFGQSSLQYTRCFYTLASLYIDMNKYAEAEGMCAAAVNFYKIILGETSADYLGALGSMGIIYQGLAKYDKAEEIFLSLKRYHESLPSPDKVTLQTLENNLGELYRHMGDYDRAEPALLKAVSLAENTPAAAFSLNNLALVQKAIGKYAEAEKSYKKAISIYELLGKTNHPDYTNPVNNLGELYRTMGRWREAIYAFREVIELRKKLLGTDHPNYANAVNNLALVEFSFGMYPEAEAHLLECKEIYKKTLGVKDKYYANSLNNLASLYKAQGKLLMAESNYKECLQIYKATYGETNDKYGIYLGGLAGTYRQMKRYNEAIALTLQSLGILKNKLGENHYDYIETEYNLAETYREAGRNIEAEKHYLNSTKGYLLLIEKYFPYLGENDKTAFYFNVSNAFETFNSFVIQMLSDFPSANHDALVMRMYDNQVALKSLLLKESEKMRALVAVSSDAGVQRDYKSWIKLRETIVQQYRLSADELNAKGISLSEMELQADKLEQRIAIALKTGLGKKDSKPISWKDVQAGLKPGEYAIEIIRTDFYTKGKWTDSIFYSALVIDKVSLVPKLILLKNGNELESRFIVAYRKAIKSKLTDEFSYDAFWKPLEGYLNKATKIYFSPDGVYQQLNLNTLKNPVTRKYLLEQADISLVSNTSDILLQRVTVASRKAEIFSFPDYGTKPSGAITAETRELGLPDIKELPGTKIEADSIKTILASKNWEVEIHLQKEATEEIVKKVNNPRVLHIATHGFFLKDIKDSTQKVFGLESGAARKNPLLRSGLILAGAAAIANDSLADNTKDDGILTAYEALGLNLTGTDLVVLSACETGLGELLNGQGVYGLQRAFLVAGAQSVIMSLWKVDDAATQELMAAFYREWLKDPSSENKQKAFHTAQLMLNEKYTSPYYWGAFVIVGE